METDSTPTPACPCCGAVARDTALLNAVLHQLEEGPASDGDPDDLRWCARAVREYLENGKPEAQETL